MPDNSQKVQFKFKSRYGFNLSLNYVMDKSIIINLETIVHSAYRKLKKMYEKCVCVGGRGGGVINSLNKRCKKQHL